MKNFVLIIDGPMGSGKTTIGSDIHTHLERTALLNTANIKFFVSDFSSTPEDNSMTADVLFAMAQEYVKHGINLLLPQAFWKREFVEPYIKLAQDNDYVFLMYQLTAPDTVLRERIATRGKVVPQERIDANLKKWEENRYELGKTLNTSELSHMQAAEIILNDLKNL